MDTKIRKVCDGRIGIWEIEWWCLMEASKMGQRRYADIWVETRGGRRWEVGVKWDGERLEKQA